MRGKRIVVAAGLTALLAGGVLVAPASAVDPITSLPGKVTLTYTDASTRDEVTVTIPAGDIACQVSSVDGWSTKVVGRAVKDNGVKIRPVDVSTPPVCADGKVSWTVKAKYLGGYKTRQANAVVKFISAKGDTTTVYSLVVKVQPVTGKVTGRR